MRKGSFEGHSDKEEDKTHQEQICAASNFAIAPEACKFTYRMMCIFSLSAGQRQRSMLQGAGIRPR